MAGELEVEHDLVVGLGAADEDAALLLRLERVGPVADLAAHQPGHAGMADAGPAAPPDRDVARLRELEQAGERGVPWNRQGAAAERDGRAAARLARRRVAGG